MKLKMFCWYKKDADKYKSISSLKGKQVGAQQSTTQQEIGQTQLKNSNLVTESLVTSLTTELSEGKLDGVIVENEIANNYLKQYPNKYAIAKVKLTTPKQYRQVNVALRKGDKGLLKRVNKEITKLQKSGEMTKLFKKAEKIQTEYSK